MKKTTVAFLAAGAAVLLASCATAPRAKTLTIELFDSKASPVVVQRTPGSSVDLPLPAVPDDASAAALAGTAEVSVQAAANDSLAPEAALPALSVPRPPETTASLSFDAGLNVPIRPRVRASFAMAAPSVPAAKQVTPPAPRQTASKSTPTVQAPQPARPAQALQPAQPAQALQPAQTAQALQPAPTAQPAPAAAAPYGRLREIYARQGDVLQVGLDGVGFLFLGFPDSIGQTPGMSFKSKENRNNKTWFTFQALKLGTYDLDFLQQDNMAGKSAKETVRVHVVTDQDFNTAVAPQQGQDPAGQASAETGDPVFAQKLSTLGSYQAAVVELLKGYKDGNPALNDQIAGLYVRMGSYDAAGKYYGKNMSPQSAYTPSAVVGLVRIAVVQNDQQELLSLLRQFLALQDPAVEEPLIQAVRMEKARSEIGMALDLAGEYVKRFPDGAWRDEADYLSAQLLEADSPVRDIARARDLYAGILSGHPESAFADAARQRLQYIDRHFIQVR
jgi:hypothetical protein